MLQIKIIHVKIKPYELELHLMYTHNKKFTRWIIPLKEPIRGYKLPCKAELRRSMYNLAYSFEDKWERHVLITTCWYIYYSRTKPRKMYVWVKDGFLEQIDEKYNKI